MLTAPRALHIGQTRNFVPPALYRPGAIFRSRREISKWVCAPGMCVMQSSLLATSALLTRWPGSWAPVEAPAARFSAGSRIVRGSYRTRHSPDTHFSGFTTGEGGAGTPFEDAC